MNWNKMMMDCILAKDEKEFEKKKEDYVEQALKVLKEKVVCYYCDKEVTEEELVKGGVVEE